MIFTVIPPAPVITSFSPASGSAGDVIAISGTNFSGVTSLRFNGVAANFTVQSATQITATVPQGCGSGLISVQTAGGIAYSATGFTVAATGAIALSWQDEGNTITTQATAINFVGAGVVASNTGGVVTVSISGAGGGSTSSNIVLLVHMDGSNGSTTFTDERGHIVSAQGNAQISTAQSKFGGASAYFDGTVNALSINSSNNLVFQTSDFTIECWVRLVGYNTLVIFENRGVTNDPNGFVFYIDSSGRLRLYTYTEHSLAPTAIPLNTWTHIAFCRSGSSHKLFCNGQLDFEFQLNSSFTNTTTKFIGQSFDGSSSNGLAYLDEFAIAKGIARYIASFTPPAAPFS